MRKTKIIVTVGPSIESEEVLREVLKEADVARFNFSHNEQEWHKRMLEKVRKIQEELKRPIATIADLQGPKIRIGEMTNPVEFFQDEIVAFTPTKEKHNPDKKIIYVDYPKMHIQMKAGDKIMLDNGLSAELIVTEIKDDLIFARVIFGGIVKGRKTVNLPGVFVELPILTEKDFSDLNFILPLDFDYIALSFVRKPSEVLELRKILDEKKSDKKILVKIEDQFGVENFDEIMAVSDGCIIARGDMGAEMELEKIPSVQKEMIRISRKHGKPAVVATHMLESMVKNPMPTRAETTDVANAVWQKCDSVWLSEESSVGAYPVRAVSWLVRIINETEKSVKYEMPKILEEKDKLEKKEKSDKQIMISGSAYIAQMVDAKAFVVMTRTGKTASIASSIRTDMKILAFCPNKRVQNQLALNQGVSAFEIEFLEDPNKTFEKAVQVIKEKNLLEKGDKFVLLSDVEMLGEKKLSAQIREL